MLRIVVGLVCNKSCDVVHEDDNSQNHGQDCNKNLNKKEMTFHTYLVSQCQGQGKRWQWICQPKYVGLLVVEDNEIETCYHKMRGSHKERTGDMGNINIKISIENSRKVSITHFV